MKKAVVAEDQSKTVPFCTGSLRMVLSIGELLSTRQVKGLIGVVRFFNRGLCTLRAFQLGWYPNCRSRYWYACSCSLLAGNTTRVRLSRVLIPGAYNTRRA